MGVIYSVQNKTTNQYVYFKLWLEMIWRNYNYVIKNIFHCGKTKQIIMDPNLLKQLEQNKTVSIIGFYIEMVSINGILRMDICRNQMPLILHIQMKIFWQQLLSRMPHMV